MWREPESNTQLRREHVSVSLTFWTRKAAHISVPGPLMVSSLLLFSPSTSQPLVSSPTHRTSLSQLFSQATPSLLSGICNWLRLSCDNGRVIDWLKLKSVKYNNSTSLIFACPILLITDALQQVDSLGVMSFHMFYLLPDTLNKMARRRNLDGLFFQSKRSNFATCVSRTTCIAMQMSEINLKALQFSFF